MIWSRQFIIDRGSSISIAAVREQSRQFNFDRNRSKTVTADRYRSWLDDLLCLVQSSQHAAHLRLFSLSLGFCLNDKKCVWEPQRHLEYLGFNLDLVRGRVLIPDATRSPPTRGQQLPRQRADAPDLPLGDQDSAAHHVDIESSHSKKGKTSKYSKSNVLTTILQDQSEKPLKSWRDSNPCPWMTDDRKRAESYNYVNVLSIQILENATNTSNNSMTNIFKSFQLF